MATMARNPLWDVQPFEESQGAERGRLSVEQLRNYYASQEAREARELDQRSSRRSRWSRKSSAKSIASMTQEIIVSGHGDISPSVKGKERESDSESGPREGKDERPPSPGGPPAWHRKQGDWNSTPPAYYRSYYTIDNPVGPRWYLNHHLLRADARSQLRPPLSHHHPAHPSTQNSLPDPSQPHEPRKRKISATNPNVHLLDGSDPWGTNWHHDSPYDIGLERTPEPTVRFYKITLTFISIHSSSLLECETLSLISRRRQIKYVHPLCLNRHPPLRFWLPLALLLPGSCQNEGKTAYPAAHPLTMNKRLPASPQAVLDCREN
ncbi:hypothetical protein SISSUDRAFT_306140 [Sistotremastrum suecicum HHB10207 ss-3]|uniref:Uncharacterized protein n=1 Tax=Sistotremastrum suecicum HHB10207 ss-3 TaxID=1314776 RepID=A0A166G7H8_9AGAM|nr:hypothetical protein SISSUDRAFT_306140 [Sistotremastrum suecicum HHB10207 ss-3]